MPSPIYDRKWRISIETFRGSGIDIASDVDTPSLRVTFRVEKNINKTMQTGEVVFYNLSPQTETDIFKNAKNVIIEAGYVNEPYGQIFKGEVRQTLRGKENGTDYDLKLVCIAGDDVLNIGFCSLVLQGSQKARDVALTIARSSVPAFDLDIKGNLTQQALQKSKVIFGKPSDELRSIAINNNAAFYMADTGNLTISTLSQNPPPIVPELNAASGLVGFPAQTDDGIHFQCFINSDISIDKWVKLNNQDIIQSQIQFGVPQTLLDLDGLYRVINIVATGDTRGNDWYYDVDAVNQYGGLPLMLSDPNRSGF